MSYQSDLGTNPLIIDDSNAAQFVEKWRDEGRAFGMTPRDYRAAPFGSASFPAVDLSMGAILQRSQFADAIKRADEARTTPDDWRKAMGVPIENQGNWGYCWAHGTINAVEITYAMTGHNCPNLNPFPVAYRIKGGRNQGGWGEQALKGIAEFGIPEHSVWPGNKEGMSQWQLPEVVASANRHKVTASLELPQNNFAALVTSLTHPKFARPVTMGLNWWGHLVCAVRAVALPGGGFGILIVNSWGEGWGQNGCGVLVESKSIAFEQIRIERCTPILAA
jgi:hypothetical protein